MAEKEFYSFDEALKELRLKEEELKRLVSEGEIRAFREGETMKLRKADVENLRKELTGGEVVELGGVAEELVFEDDTDLDAGMKTEEITEADTLLDEGIEEVTAVNQELLLEEEERAEEEEEEEEAPVRRVVEAPEEVTEGMGMRIALILTALILVFATPVIASLSTGRITSISRSIGELFGAVK